MLAAGLFLVAAASVLQAQTQVWIFVRTDCPISNRYAPTIERLYQTFGKQGFEFKLIYPEEGATRAAVETHRKEYSLTLPYEIDAKQQPVRKAGIQVTPEVAVFLKDGKLVYRGRIDDRQASLAVTRRGAVRNDLAEVLEAIGKGETPPFRSTKAFGCAIERNPDAAGPGSDSATR